MITIRKAAERGATQLDWLESYHSFSFGQYYDPKHMGFASLRVINDDTVIAGAGFGQHPHNDAEIVSYVLEGAMEHRDSMGNGSVIRAGDVQHMSAGHGIVHSEFNHSDSEPVRFLQIWFMPDKTNIEPKYQQRSISEADKRGKLKLIASPQGDDETIQIQQDVFMYSGLFDAAESVSYTVKPDRSVWVQVANGTVQLNNIPLEQGDGAAISDEQTVEISDGKNAEVLLFDLGSNQ